MSDAGLSPFGRVLRRWRGARGMSQLALATEAATSTRHLSFLETGRAQPSREMVLRLANALDVPLRERNALLAAAGFAALYRESALDAPAMSALSRMIDFTLARFEPFPAFLVDRCFRMLRANAAAAKTLAGFASAAPVWREQPPNILKLTLHPDALAPHIVNFHEVAAAMLTRLERAVTSSGGDPELAALERELRALPGMPDASGFPAAIEPVMPLHLKRGELEVRLFTMLSQVGGAQDVTASELHIETLMPADAASEAVLRALAES
ncbi:MAG: helix-turn-helix transcriptional regulator [Deltaproteobacteria bacterium]|nr:helix-turn-helix transcriptional regulator [Deltaproteobacteria bacterium]